tara:strand:+ start:132 stop:359 length:228 start_codon:yes stop_codon:yes gene_type:complete
MKIEEIDMNLKEEYQAKVTSIERMLTKLDYDQEMRDKLENLKSIYENRIESIENVAKNKKEKEARDKARDKDEEK